MIIIKSISVNAMLEGNILVLARHKHCTVDCQTQAGLRSPWRRSELHWTGQTVSPTGEMSLACLGTVSASLSESAQSLFFSEE